MPELRHTQLRRRRSSARTVATTTRPAPCHDVRTGRLDGPLTRTPLQHWPRFGLPRSGSTPSGMPRRRVPIRSVPGLPAVVVPSTRHSSSADVGESRDHARHRLRQRQRRPRRHAQLTTDGTLVRRGPAVEQWHLRRGRDRHPPTSPIAIGRKVEVAEDARIYVGSWTRIVLRGARRRGLRWSPARQPSSDHSLPGRSFTSRPACIFALLVTGIPEARRGRVITLVNGLSRPAPPSPCSSVECWPPPSGRAAYVVAGWPGLRSRWVPRWPDGGSQSGVTSRTLPRRPPSGGSGALTPASAGRG